MGTKLQQKYRATAILLALVLVSASAEAQTALGPYDFENSLGNWRNVTGDDLPWTRDSGGTPSVDTGPSSGHAGSTWYMYVEASGNGSGYPNKVAHLDTPCMRLLRDMGSGELRFWYHMYGASMGTLHVDVAAESDGVGCNAAFATALSISGDQGDSWQEAVVDLSAYAGKDILIRFRGVTGSSWQSDMAIDDIQITGTPPACSSNPQCDDGIACTTDVCGVGGSCENTLSCASGERCNESSGICELPPAQPLVDALDYDAFKAHVQFLSSSDPPIGGSRHWSQPGNAAALDYIEDELESYGYTVERHAYTFSSQTRENVYATKVGSLHPDEMYIVSAHMDSFNQESSGSVFAPGANDDASGTAMVLEAARVFAESNVETEYSVRFILWNNEETGLDGSEAYVSDRRLLQGVENPPGSGVYPEPSWRGVVQHDMMMWDHGMPPGPNQIPAADVDIEYQATATFNDGAIDLAYALLGANLDYATDYPAEVSSEMANTDSVSFQGDAPAVSVRENRRVAEIGAGSDPNWHRNSDVYATYSEADFTLGFNAIQGTVGAVAELAGTTVIECGNSVVETGEQCDDGNTAPGDCCSDTCQYEIAGSACADADVCNGSETCDGVGLCQAGTPLVCDNALFCDGSETCDMLLGCQAGLPPVIDDGVACTDDSCDEAGDVVVNAPNDGLCDNALFCDGSETCDMLLGCQAGLPPVIDDAVACTDDSCDEAGDVVVNAPNDGLCDNALFCDGSETCDMLFGCQAGLPPVIDDGVACTDDSCDEAGDVVVNAPNDGLCDNALFCDGSETCDALVGCQAGLPPVVDDGIACTDDLCIEDGDVIVHAANSALCDNGLGCDGSEMCAETLGCQSAAPIDCDDGDVCTADSCDEVTGCGHEPIVGCQPQLEVPSASRFTLGAIVILLSMAGLLAGRRVRLS